MAIRRKPKSRSIDEFIAQGGGEAQTGPGDTGADIGVGAKIGHDRQVQNVRLRVDTQLLEQIDQAVEGRRSGMSRHTWILEAIVEKLDREGEAER